jgi:hypothetical protein
MTANFEKKGTLRVGDVIEVTTDMIQLKLDKGEKPHLSWSTDFRGRILISGKYLGGWRGKILEVGRLEVEGHFLVRLVGCGKPIWFLPSHIRKVNPLDRLAEL